MDGTVLKRVDFPSPEVMGGPTVVALRPAVHGALLEAVGEHKVKLGCEATGFSVAGDRVTLRTVAGDIAEGDLLVYWALSLAEELVPAGMRDDPAAILRHMAPRFEETFRGVTAETTDMRVDELCDRDPLPFWGKGPVTLLGDAAHPVLPHTGQGAAQAMVDAVVLGQALGENGDVEGALRSYERHRREKTAILVAQGRRTARIMGTMNPVACRLREVAVRLAPIKTLVKMLAAINRRAGTDVSR